MGNNRLIAILVITAWFAGTVVETHAKEEQNFSSSLNLMKERFTSAVKQVTVNVDETNPIKPGHSTRLFCNYLISTGEDLPVTVTWKVGDGPRNAINVFTCKSYTKDKQTCQEQETDKNYQGRVVLGSTSPSLIFITVEENDNHMFWCQISLEGNDKAESLGVGMDMKSVALMVSLDHLYPKMHTVNIEKNVVSQVGDEVTIFCECEDGGHHCDDIRWYKGPRDVDNTNYEPVYSRINHSRPTNTENVAHGEWIGRTSLNGKSLVIEDVTLDDSGRYWCEIRAMGYVGIGEMATDAKSTVLQVNPAGSVIN